MLIQRLLLVCLMGLIVAGCSNQPNYSEKGNPAYLRVKDSIADEVYLNRDAAEGLVLEDIRKIWIAPVNMERTQLIQPRGVKESDLDAWVMTPEEDVLLQNSLLRTVTDEMEFQGAYDVVESRDQAEIILYSTMVAVHPYQPQSYAAAGQKIGGAITMSFSIVNATNDRELIRMLDSKSTDNIWAFHNVKNARASDLIFSAWGDQMRRGLLHLQGRYTEPTQMRPMILKEQG